MEHPGQVPCAPGNDERIVRLLGGRHGAIGGEEYQFWHELIGKKTAVP
jgi:hypothetical protein